MANGTFLLCHLLPWGVPRRPFPPRPPACPGPSAARAGGSGALLCSRGPGRCREGAAAASASGKAGSPFSGLSLAAQLHNAGVWGLFWATLISWPTQDRAVAEPAAGQRHEEPHQQHADCHRPRHHPHRWETHGHQGASSTVTKNSPKPSSLHQPYSQTALLTDWGIDKP